MITAIALDDEPLALQVIETFCNRLDTIELAAAFTDTTKAERYLAKYPVDLLFLDINMPSISGIDFYKIVPRQTLVIFTTAYSEYAVEGFNLSATDFLLKPIEFSRFEQALNKAIEFRDMMQKSSAEPGHIFIRADYSLVKISLDDILYIEGLDNYLKINLQGGQKPVVARMSMKSMADRLPESNFVRVHRSFIVPIGKIDFVRNRSVHIGKTAIPIGTNYVEAVIAMLGNA